jgi:hypothetical protein
MWRDQRVSHEGKKIIYISGPMTGLPEYNYPEFNRVAAILEEKGYIVVNPTSTGFQRGWIWKQYLIVDLVMLLTGGGQYGAVDHVVTLDGWEKSKGARLEVHVARELEIPVESIISFLLEGGVEDDTAVGL